MFSMFTNDTDRSEGILVTVVSEDCLKVGIRKESTKRTPTYPTKVRDERKPFRGNPHFVKKHMHNALIVSLAPDFWETFFSEPCQ